MSDPIDISIVIPAYNEAKRLPSFLGAVISYCEKSSLRYEILVVDDGSVHVQIHILVDSNRENETPVFPIEGRKVCPAAAQRNPKGRSSDDHRRSGQR